MNKVAESQHVTGISAENYRRLGIVNVEFEGTGTVTIAGKNEQGKSTLLDCIMAAFDNRSVDAPDPIKTGKDRAEVIVTTDAGLVIKRTWTASGTKLEVSNQDGAVFKSPQKMLDKLVGAIAFDLHEFANMKPAEQAECLRRLVGIDTTELDEQRKSCYAKRTDVGRDRDELDAQLKGMTFHEEIADPVTIASLLDECDKIKTHNDTGKEFERKLESLHERQQADEATLARERSEIEEIAKSIAELKLKKAKIEGIVVDRESRIEETRSSIADATSCLERFEPQDDSSYREQISNAETTNAAISEQKAENARYKEIRDKLKKKQESYQSFTFQIKQVDQEREAMIQSANFPVDGLGFSENGTVTIDGVPLEQGSSAQVIAISAAIAMAMNPTLKVILIRDASLLDEDHLAAVIAMAEEKGYQVFLEIVANEKGNATLFIQDGEVVGS